MLSKLFIHISVLVFLALGCKSKSENAENSLSVDFGDSIKIFKNPNRIRLSDHEKIAFAIPLDSLTKGFNDFQIRIWLGHSMAVKHDIIIIKRTGNSYAGELLTYTDIGFRKFDKQIKILDYKKTLPKSGWKALFESQEWVQMQEFFNICDSITFSGDGGGDGISYIFEIASKDKFKTCEFSNPENDSSNNVHARNILKFADFLEKEFSFKFIR